MKKEFKVIADLLPNNTRVLDVGCGDGSLMNLLEKEKNIEVRGLELNQDNVQQCIHKGLPVIQGNAETELHQFPNQSFDYVVLSIYQLDCRLSKFLCGFYKDLVPAENSY